MLCSVQDVSEGMCTAAAVFHPRRPDIELIAGGVLLDRQVLGRLPHLGVHRIWVEYDATTDLDNLIQTRRSAALDRAFDTIKQDFSSMSVQTVTAANIQTYRQVVMELMCDLFANRHIANLTEQLIDGQSCLFTHCANVAYLSLLVGIDLETYIVQERSRLGTRHARDLTSLGMGAMLHDIGKTVLGETVGDVHELDFLIDETDETQRDNHREHVLAGYRMLQGTRAPASATQVVLTHHQRFDGSGFPDMAEATGGRVEGTQHGVYIHVFSRIAAACNLLENLLNRTGKKNPPVIALRAFLGERFDGWFDPVVRDSVLRRIPPFPVGGSVRLSNGKPAVVVTPSLEQPCRPIVRLLSEQDRLPDGQFMNMNLREHPGLHIADYAGIPVEPYLFTLVEDEPLSTKVTSGKNKPDGLKRPA